MHLASARIEARFTSDVAAAGYDAAIAARLAAAGVSGRIRRLPDPLRGGHRVVAGFSAPSAQCAEIVSWANGELAAPVYAGDLLDAAAREHVCAHGDGERFCVEREAWRR